MVRMSEQSPGPREVPQLLQRDDTAFPLSQTESTMDATTPMLYVGKHLE